jgi:hypothetical protein
MAATKMWRLDGFSKIFILWAATRIGCAQDLVPRAYLVAPVGSNAITISSSYFDGSVFTDPTVPITDFKVRFSAAIISYTRSFAFFGRSANVVGSIPYTVGNFHGIVVGAERSVYRSGLADGRIRFAMNLRGGAAMNRGDFVKWREKFVLGASLTVIAPIGQYDPARLINPSLHRWAFKPELGMARRWGKWALDLYGGVWLFTPNHAYYPGMNTRTQAPVGALETHLSYTPRPRLWASLDGNFWTGGRSTVNASRNQDYQRNSRVGATVSVPLNRHQALKFSYSTGAYISIGGDYKNVSVAWQYSWLSGPK